MSSQNVLIVGGSRGIGFGIVERFSKRGANVTVLSRSPGQLAGLPSVTHIPFDAITDEISATALPESIDAFAYCPGSINLAPLRSVSLQMIRDDFELNVLGAIKCLQAALPAMKSAEASSAVFFSTVAVAQGLPMHSSVAAVKGAIESLVRTWAAELAPRVRVNCIAPALTATPLAEKFLATEEKRKAMDARYPLGRVGEISDLADAAEFLLSEKSSWITGQVFHVDGGLSTIRK